MRDVAARAGVSAKTVSRVVNHDRYISADVRQRVTQAIADLGYQPNLLARSLRSGRDDAIAVSVPDLADPFFAAVVKAVEQEARARGAIVLITAPGEDPADERPAVEALLRRQIAGLVLVPTGADHRYLAPYSRSLALVCVDRPPHHLVADTVAEDDVGAAEAAVRHLLDGGHRRIAYLAPTRRITTVQRRHEGFRRAMTQAGLPADERLEIFHADAAVSPERATQVLLDLDAPPSAVFCASAATSMRVVPYLHATGRTDLAFISFGDFPMADVLMPSVTVVDQQPAALGRLAATRLFDRIAEPARRMRRSLLLPVNLTVRESSLLPPR